MTDRIRIIKHEAVPECGSYEVRFSDSIGKTSPAVVSGQNRPAARRPSKRPRL